MRVFSDHMMEVLMTRAFSGNRKWEYGGRGEGGAKSGYNPWRVKFCL